MLDKQSHHPIPTIVILYTELADYILSCLKELSHHAASIHVFNYSVNKEAPFQFTKENYPSIFFYDKAAFNANMLIAEIKKNNPTLIYCSGWIDKDYLKAVKYFKLTTITVLGFDTKWTGSFKHYLSGIYARVYITPNFKYAFVPGNSQKKMAIKIGFKDANIILGLYSANALFFEKIYSSKKNNKQVHFPHKFIYVGRYVETKGIQNLWNAFIQLQQENPNDWELWCLGVGPIEPIKHSKIKHFGFVQPHDLDRYIQQTGVFILPSLKEPWGVVVHEFAASGFPLLLSNEIGAKEQFLTEGKNGFEFDPQSISSIKLAMKKIIELENEQLFQMGEISHQLSKSISPQTWTQSVLEMCF